MGAREIIQQFLEPLGLGSLAERLWQRQLEVNDLDRVFLELEDYDEFKARFPAFHALRDAGRAISVGQYVGLERTFKQIFASAGLPRGMYDQPDDFAELIGGEVSPQEVADRV